MAWGLPSRQTVGLTRRVTATPSATLHRHLVLAGNSFPVILDWDEDRIAKMSAFCRGPELGTRLAVGQDRQKRRNAVSQ